jgi:hypothetical protein
VLDTKTGITWDINMHPLANWGEASTTCANAGMRLPTIDEWSGVIQLGGVTNCQSPSAPFDQSAMPTTPADMGGTSSSTVFVLWTGTVEDGTFGGNVYVMAILQPSAGRWGTNSSDEPVTAKLAYRCVK